MPATLTGRAESSGFSTSAIVGVSIGCGIATFAILSIAVWMFLRWKDQQPRAVISTVTTTSKTSRAERAFPLVSTASSHNDPWLDDGIKPGYYVDSHDVLETSSISRIRQHEFEHKPKRVQREAKHARRSVLRRATQDESLENEHAYSMPHGLDGWHGGGDSGSVNIREWSAGISSGRGRGTHHASIIEPPLPQSPLLTSSRPTTPKLSPSTPLGFSEIAGVPHSGTTLHAPQSPAMSAFSPRSTANRFPPEKTRAHSATEHDAGFAYSPTVSPLSAGPLSSPFSPSESAYFSPSHNPISPPPLSASRHFQFDEKHPPPRRSRSGSASDSRHGHKTNPLQPYVDISAGSPAFLHSDPAENMPSDRTQRPGYDPKRGTVLPSYRTVVPGTSPP